MITQLIQIGNLVDKFRSVPFDYYDDSLPLKVMLQENAQQQLLVEKFRDCFVIESASFVRIDKAKLLVNLCEQLYHVLRFAHIACLAYFLPAAFRLFYQSKCTMLWTSYEAADVVENIFCITPGADRPWLVTTNTGTPLPSPSFQPPDMDSLLAVIDNQPLLDFEHATKLYFGDEPEPDIDEPKEVTEYDIDDYTRPIDDEDVPF